MSFRAAAFLVLLTCVCAGLPERTGLAASISRSRPFQGLIRREQAESAATCAAKLAAWREAEQTLARRPELAHASVKRGTQPFFNAELSGLALQTYALQVSAIGLNGFPPHMRARVELSFVPETKFREKLLKALRKPEDTRLYALGLQRLETLLQRYDQQAAALLQIPPQSAQGKAEALAVAQLAKAMHGTSLHLELLPRLLPTREAPETLLDLLQKAAELDPENPLIMTGQAELLLGLDRPLEAQEQANKAIKQMPDLARAHDIKGTALLRQGLPTLATSAFSEAIALAPGHAAYKIHRAAAYLVQKENEAMCLDLYDACALNDCEDLTWAREKGQCPQ